MRLPSKIRFIFRKIKHFWQWAPIIWNDEDWDSGYLYEIMRFKIAKLRVDMEKDHKYQNTDKYIRNMKIAEELLRRQSNSDFYFDNEQAFKVHGLCTCGEVTFETEPSECGLLFKWKNPFCSWCRNKHILKLSSVKENEDFAYLWHLMNKDSRRWWN